LRKLFDFLYVYGEDNDMFGLCDRGGIEVIQAPNTRFSI